MWGSQEKNLGPKVNVKYVTVDPYTPCNRVSRLFRFVRCLCQKGKSNIDSFDVYVYVSYALISATLRQIDMDIPLIC